MISNSPGKENHTPPRQTRSAKRRIAALVDEDSVDYVPIQKPDSAKKIKLTDHQKEVFLAPRDKLPYMEEESIQIKSDILQFRVGSQYDVESNEASVSNFSKAGAKGPASFEALHAEQKKKAVLASNNNSAEQKRKGRSKKRVEGTSSPKKKASPDKEKEGSPVKRIGRPRKNQTESQKGEENKKKEEMEPSTVRVKSPEPEEKSADEDEAIAVGTRSRRSLLKGTPTKYVPKTRNASKSARKEKEEKKKGKQVAESDDDDVPIGLLTKKASKDSKSLKEAPEGIKEQEQQASEPIVEEKKEAELVSEPQKIEEQPFGPYIGQKSEAVEELEPIVLPTTPNEDQPSPPAPDADVLQTPPRNNDVQITANPANLSTPGILKPTATPTTQDRKMLHVHFDQEVGMKDDGEKTPKRKRIDCFFKKAEPSKEPLCPGLIGNTTPIAKIVHQLTPISSHGAFKILQSRLANHKIGTVGDLAATSESVLSKVSIKFETAKKALEEFSKTAANDQGVGSSSLPPPFKVPEVAEREPAFVPPEDNEEVGELKIIEGLSPIAPEPKKRNEVEKEEEEMQIAGKPVVLEDKKSVEQMQVVKKQMETTPVKETAAETVEPLETETEEALQPTEDQICPAFVPPEEDKIETVNETEVEEKEAPNHTDAEGMETEESDESAVVETEVDQPKSVKKDYNFRIFQIGFSALRDFVKQHEKDLSQEEKVEIIEEVTSLLEETKKILPA